MSHYLIQINESEVPIKNGFRKLVVCDSYEEIEKKAIELYEKIYSVPVLFDRVIYVFIWNPDDTTFESTCSKKVIVKSLFTRIKEGDSKVYKLLEPNSYLVQIKDLSWADQLADRYKFARSLSGWYGFGIFNDGFSDTEYIKGLGGISDVITFSFCRSFTQRITFSHFDGWYRLASIEANKTDHPKRKIPWWKIVMNGSLVFANSNRALAKFKNRYYYIEENVKKEIVCCLCESIEDLVNNFWENA